MEVIQSENIKVPNSVLVGRLTGDEADKEVMEYLEQFGSIGRVVKVTSEEAQFKDTAIVEFATGEPIQLLQDNLPCQRSSRNPDVIHHIQLLSELYAAEKVSSISNTYLTELKSIAKLSGADFEKLLLDELARIQESSRSQPTPKSGESEVSSESQCISNTAHAELLTTENQTPLRNGTDATNSHDSLPMALGTDASSLRQKRTLCIPSDQLTTPEVQRVVIEHVIKNSDISSSFHGHVKLRPFSGKIPCPYSESDYDTWRNNVEFYFTDSTVSDKHAVRKIVESLFPPAANIVKQLGPNSTAHDYLSLLDSAYGTVDDGDELFAKFLNTNQNSELLLLLRTEEDRQAAKSNRRKQHLGVPRAKTQTNSLMVEEHATGEMDIAATSEHASSHGEHKLEKQIVKLQAQIASLKASLKSSSTQISSKQRKNLKPKTKVSSEKNPLFTKKPRPWYCFKCGEDGHIAPSCTNEPNPELVEVEHQTQLPKGLVGQKCIANVIVSGVDSNCLLDTGSQVTTISASFYNNNLSEHPIQPIDCMTVEGANGQDVPYLGYVPISLKFPKDFVETEPEVSTLALVVPDLRVNSDLPVLIGTNALDVLYDEHCHGKNPNDLSSVYGYRQILRTLRFRNKVSSTGKVGLLTLTAKVRQVIPAQGRVLIEGFVKTNAAGECAVVEQPTTSVLPESIFVECCLVTLPKQRPYKLPVWIRNEAEHDITLPSKCVLAELHTPSEVYDHLPSSKQDAHTVKCCTVTSTPATEASKSDLSFDFGDRITRSLNAHADVFAQHDLDFGHASKVKHHINLKDETPFKQRYRPIHPSDFEAVRKHLQTLLDAGVIRESQSPYSSPIVVVLKKNGDVRLCIDFRKLNALTIRDAYALPNLEEAFSALAGSKWFSVMDLKSGYYQIEMEECDKPKTAFVCPLGFYEFNRMPQGVTNAPSTFQRLMERCMDSLNLKEVLVFLDDIIVFSSTLEEHETRILHVLQQLREYGLKLSPTKCHFFQSSVRYLGHIVSSKGVETDPEKVSALRSWPRPQTLSQLKSFLGFAGYYHRFVKDYSKIVKPLNDLTKGYPPYRKGRKATSCPVGYFNPKTPFSDRWTPACQEAFEAIIIKLISSPVLGFANPKLPYVLHTDASTSGLGAALYQEQEGEMRVIAYASRGLSPSEKRYPAHKLEFLALKWSINEKFQDYLYGNIFTVVTDNNPLTYVLKSAKLGAASYRWLAALSTFDFNIKYRAGKNNQDADGLSRRPHDPLADDPVSLEEREQIKQFASNHLSSIYDQSMIVL
ncbi:hypothetical protein MHYP_G00328160 [Metynnis hypsauchen]